MTKGERSQGLSKLLSKTFFLRYKIHTFNGAPYPDQRDLSTFAKESHTYVGKEFNIYPTTCLSFPSRLWFPFIVLYFLLQLGFLFQLEYLCLLAYIQFSSVSTWAQATAFALHLSRALRMDSREIKCQYYGCFKKMLRRRCPCKACKCDEKIKKWLQWRRPTLREI